MINSIGVSNVNYNVNSVSSAAAPAAKEIEFSYNPQDNVVMSPVTTHVGDVTMGKHGPQTSRVKLDADLKPNEDGNFVFDQKDSKNYTSAHTFATVAKTLEMFESAFGEKVPWRSSGDTITVRPDRGEMLNAYYSRSDCSVNFFHSFDKQLGEMVYSGQSGEAVSHEVGHAMLDGIRPGYLNSWSPDPLGFHESFADMMGLFMATQDDKTCEIAARETGGDMKKENCIARTAEELGTAINRAVGKNKTGGDFIRNANNTWKWQDPSTLPENPGSDKLGTEMHNWSRVWTGAVYDIYAGIVSRNVSNGMEPKDAIKAGGAEMIELYGHLMHEAPRGDFTYKQMANCMLKADAEHMGGKNSELIRNSMTNRLILPEGEIGTEDMDIGPRESRMMTVTLDGDGFGMFSGAKVETPVDANSIFTSSTNSKPAQDLKTNMKRLIDAGRILYTEPNQKIEPKDLFDKNGMPYMGVARWVDGDLVIERNHVIS
ncbi:MAG: hypothetical protein Q4F00_01645 [bacterium]|nr:hypothetical protein [bacterium]